MDAVRSAKVITGISICAYEAAALAVGDSATLPPITALCHKYPGLGIAVVGWTAWHLLHPLVIEVRGERA